MAVSVAPVYLSYSHFANLIRVEDRWIVSNPSTDTEVTIAAPSGAWIDLLSELRSWMRDAEVRADIIGFLRGRGFDRGAG